jgi:alpha-L-fucosidase
VSGRIGNNVGDYDSAGDNQISFSKVSRPWETPVTLNDTWGFKKNDSNWKSPTVLIRQLAQVASRGGNYLLNVGPTAEGVIPQPSVDRLAEVGRWMKVNGGSVYGTSPGPAAYELPWGVMTMKPDKLYLHIFEWPKQEFVVYGVKSKVNRAYLLADASRKAIPVKQTSNHDHYELRLQLPANAPDAKDSVVVLDTTGSRPDFVSMLQQQPDASITLPAHLGQAHGALLRIDTRGVTEHWTDKNDWLEWEFQVSHPGSFEVALITSEQKYGADWEGGHKVDINVAGQDLKGVVDRDGKLENPSNPYWPYVRSNLGRLKIDKAGTYKLSLKPESIESAKKLGLTLVSVKMRQAR